jgi:BirA family biotin operon repressor/biotin-[acetyl-CoA-carboxylase] ligase
VTGVRAELRWPNEILLNNKKVGGILTEFDAELDRVNFVILGIGINVNLDPSAFPELAGEATSLSMETGAKVSRLELLQVLLEQIESGFRLLVGGEFDLIKERWHALGWGLGKQVQVDSAAGKESGLLRGIDDNGSLVIAKGGGEMKIAMSGDALLKVG